MKFIYLEDKKRLNDFLTSIKHNQFMQSWEWGEFQKLIGKEIVRVGIENDKEELKLVATLIKIKLPVRNAYYYIPRGPVFMNWTEELGDLFFDEVKKICQQNDAIFLRFESGFIMSEMKHPIVSTIGPLPDFSVILDLDRPEENIFNGMKSNARENISLAEKKGVKIKEGGADDFDDFWNITIKAQNRDKFLLHTEDYFRKLFKMDFIKIFIAVYNGQAVAAGLFSFWRDTVTYMHGGADDDYDKSVFPYFLQWHVMREAKKQGYKYYDLYGIDDVRWPEITEFKRSFSNEKVEYPGVHDVAFHEQWYGVYQFVRMLRKWFG